MCGAVRVRVGDWCVVYIGRGCESSERDADSHYETFNMQKPKKSPPPGGGLKTRNIERFP